MIVYEHRLVEFYTLYSSPLPWATCDLKALRWMDAAGLTSHLNWRSPLWIILCVVSEPFRFNLISLVSHLNGRSPVCDRRWQMRTWRCPNLASHSSHLNDRLPVRVLTCFSWPLLWLKSAMHIEYLNGWSPSGTAYGTLEIKIVSEFKS